MRARLAKALVRWAGRWWDASYAAYCRVDQGEMPEGYWNKWDKWAVRIDSFAIPLASFLDLDAASEQMVEEGWWG